MVAISAKVGESGDNLIIIIDLEDERLLGLDKLSLIEELRCCCCRRSFSPYLRFASFSSPFDNCQCMFFYFLLLHLANVSKKLFHLQPSQHCPSPAL